MGDRTGISWTDATWNPIRGCSRVSAGCVNCYAESVAHRFNAPGLPYEGLTTNGRWNGTVRLVPDHLADPLRWQKPRKIFANSMSDLFHESLPADEISAIFGVIALAKRHTFQVLTKRPERMRDFLLGKERVSGSSLREMCFYEARNFLGEKAVSGGTPWDAEFPLPNVWLGVSVEDQKTADARIPILLDTPASVRFVSYEPALGPVDFSRFMPKTWGKNSGGSWGCDSCCNGDRCDDRSHFSRKSCPACHGRGTVKRLDWIIVGGESGPRARPFDVGWARSTVEQCRVAGVACFVKQLGARAYWDGSGDKPPFDTLPEIVAMPAPNGIERRAMERLGTFRSERFKHDDVDTFPLDLRVQEFPR